MTTTESQMAKDNSPKKTQTKTKTRKAHFVDQPNQPVLPSPYLNRVSQLYETNKKFTLNEFQRVRIVSNRKDILDAFQRMGMILNDVLPSTLPKKEIDKVCFIVVNSHINDIDYCGTGPFNDALMIAKLHQQLKYEIFLLYNSTVEVFKTFFNYFLTYTKKNLTFYYSGHDAITIGFHGLYFLDKSRIFYDDLAKFVCDFCNGKSKILIISDCAQGGSIFDMNVVKYRKNNNPKKMSKIIVLSAVKKEIKKKRDKHLSHGLFTFLLCRLIRKNPSFSSSQLVYALNNECRRFRESFNVDVSKRNLENYVLFKKADQVFHVKKVNDDEAKSNENEVIQYFEF